MLPALIAEFLGTALLIILGNGVNGSVVLLEKEGGWVLITTGWGFAVAIAVYVTGKVSGGHINPAVTLALALRRAFPWRNVLPYWAAQVAGAFLGALIIYVLYYEALLDFEATHGVVRGTLENGKLAGPFFGGAGMFTTFPLYDRLLLNILSEVVGTSVLIIAVLALIDPRNQSPGSNMSPLLLGVVVWSIGISLGGLTNYSINPARDLGPRLVCFIFGWGSSVFQSHGGYFWVAFVGPLLGAVTGAFIYDFAIRQHLPDPQVEE